MGAKQSSSPSAAANGRTRAYSGSDLPSSTSVGDGSRRTTAPTRHHPNHGSGHPGVTSSTSQNIGGRTSSVVRSESRSHFGISIPGSSGPFSSPETSASTPEDSAESDRAEAAGPRLMVGSLPAHLSPHMFGGFKCPVCSKFVSSDDMDLHLVLCLTKPRITYNEDVLNKDTGECAICLDELEQGDTIARLPCLCIYHKICIDQWFDVNRSCPEHPSH